ncbi:MAG: extracellular solute-binding protein, partial [Rhodobacteraceae bacterium]|nr:extracellular solute-binding protein [Paracoccaceae bacterium]
KAAKAIRDQGILENPIGGAYQAGWNLGQEFNNIFLGYGGSFFKPGTAEPNVNTEAGVKTLNMMKALTEYMNPDFLTHDSNATNAEYRAGNVALLNMWGSRASQQTTTEGVLEEVVNGHAIAAPLTVGGGTTPASTLWWDGWTVGKGISDAEAEATFVALTHGIRPEMLNEKTSPLAVWLIDGYKPTDASQGVFSAAKMGTKPYPMLPFMGLMHSALGNELADFLQGKESAEQALADVEAAYMAAAKEKGFLK